MDFIVPFPLAAGLPVYSVRADPGLYPLGGSLLDCVLATVRAAEAIGEATETAGPVGAGTAKRSPGRKAASPNTAKVLHTHTE
eukprot:scaffold251560_cov33-Prasinocladus_malaysianus.AAC.1